MYLCFSRASLQKSAQMSNEMLREMMEMCCLWQWLSPSLKRMVGSGPGYDKILEAWKMGSLDSTTSVYNLMLMFVEERPSITSCVPYSSER